MANESHYREVTVTAYDVSNTSLAPLLEEAAKLQPDQPSILREHEVDWDHPDTRVVFYLCARQDGQRIGRFMVHSTHPSAPDSLGGVAAGSVEMPRDALPETMTPVTEDRSRDLSLSGAQQRLVLRLAQESIAAGLDPYYHS
ncbi:MAG TPA: hypothetical protein VLE99_05445 [Candidatus Saccharimonadales bacterium]|nr:hypothetical protein [Candidatus Saccharimonadales bacterium]